MLMSALTVLGVLLSLDLPNKLVTRKIGKGADDTDADVRNIRAQEGHGSERLDGWEHRRHKP
jgi:hypothetical protein